MLGVDKTLDFEQTADGLVVQLPEDKPCDHAWTLRITGQALRDYAPPQSSFAIEPEDDGSFVLNADDAMIHGRTPRVQKKGLADKSSVGGWSSPADWVSWRIR
jgi:hypothetical protein